MAQKRKKSKPAAGPPAIHEATLASGPSGAVIKGAVIDLATAIARRRAGLDIVVCGDDVKANGRLARQIESAVDMAKLETPHGRVGPNSLPHYQPKNRPPEGHSFYETDNPQRKARRRQP